MGENFSWSELEFHSLLFSRSWLGDGVLISKGTENLKGIVRGQIRPRGSRNH